MTIDSHIDISSCAYEFTNIVSRQIQIFCWCARAVVFASTFRYGLFNLCASRPIIVAGYIHKLRTNCHGRTPCNTKVMTVAAMASCATGFRLFLVFIVAGTNGRYKNQFKFVCRFLQCCPIFPCTGVRCTIAWYSRIKTIEICGFN